MQAVTMSAEHRSPRPAPTVVLGLGATGLSVVRHLRARGERVLVLDSRREPPALGALRRELPDVGVELGPFDPERVAGAARLIVSPGVPLAEPAIRRAAARGVEVLGDVELFAREVAAPVAAITGSNGKSTVTALLGEIAARAGRQVRVGGNLGTPALDLLRDAPADLYVLELSSFQLESTTSLAPEVAAVLNVSPDHLDRYPSVSAYAAAKARILAHARSAVLNLDDERVAAMARPGLAVSGFSIGGAAGAIASLLERPDGTWLALAGRPILAAASVPMVGRHNLANALAAMALAHVLDIPRSAIRDAVCAFRPLAHRCVLVTEQRGVRWIDDSKGTNVGATVAAIAGVATGRNLVLIAGGEGKQQDFSPLAEPMAEHVHTLVLIGRDAPEIARIAPRGVRVRNARDMDDAVQRARDAARDGDVVLLSPACASFDMFASYEARGDAFAEAVHRGGRA